MPKSSRRHADAFYAVDAGVVADGVTDDQPALAEAITRSKLLAGNKPGTVILPAGDMYLGSTLDVDDDQRVVGVGMDATRMLFDGAVGLQVGGNGVRTLRSSFRDFSINGMGDTGQVGARLGDDTATPKTGSGVFERVRFEECATAGLDLAQVAYLGLKDCDLISNGGDGLVSDPALTTTGQNTTLRAIGCRFQDNNIGAAIRTMNTSSFIGCSFELNQREGLLIETPSAGPVGTGIRAMWVTDCYFENNLADGGAGGQMRWGSVTGTLIAQLIVTRPFFSLPGAGAGQYNMDIGTGIASIEYAEQLNASSIVRNESNTFLYVKDSNPPTNSRWDWDSSTGLAKINHEVYNGGAQRWQRWANSPAGATLMESVDTNDARRSWFGATEVSQQTGVPVTAAGIHAALANYGLIT